MKRLVVLIASLLACVPLSAQQKDKHNFEVGADLNVYGILGAVGGPSRGLAPGAFFEYRYDFTDHIDFGAQLSYDHSSGKSAFTGSDTPRWGIVYNQVALKAVADYNMCPNRLVRPYIGVGLGAGLLVEDVSAGFTDTSDVFGVVGPRIGVQIWRFRLTLEFDFAFDGQYGFLHTETSTGLNLGFTF